MRSGSRATTSRSAAADSRRAGVATVFQDLALVEVLDVATNMFLGQFPRRGWFVDRKAMEAQSRAFLEEHKVTVASVKTEIGMLSGGQRQIVAIARAMRTGAGIVLLDEPTAALGVRETAHATSLIRELPAGHHRHLRQPRHELRVRRRRPGSGHAAGSCRRRP